MAGSKQRASMREGPLAALFRKTEEEGQGGGQADAGNGEPGGDDRDGAEPVGKTAAESAGRTAADRRRRTAADRPDQGQLEVAGTGAAGEGSREGDPARARLGGEPPKAGAPHPSLAPRSARVAADGGRELEDELGDDLEDEHQVPSPKERLLNAFSADVPGNVPRRPGAREVSGRGRGTVRIGELQASAPTRVGAPGHPVIRVVGVGGAGTNAVNRMVEAEVEGVEFIAVNTDLQSLQQSSADLAVHIGVELTRGLGSGSDASVGRQAAMDDYDRVKALLRGSDMVFIAAGAGGGTGTGAAPVVARMAREVGALTVAIVTRPFGFEGSRRAEQAGRGIEALAEEVDTLIVVPNNRLLSILDKQTSMMDAFKVADDVLRQGVQGISDLVTLPGLINLDFADVRTIMSDAGNALLGIGMGTGETRATDAAMKAVSSPLLETSMEGARSILLSITGGSDLSLWEVNEAAKAVSEAAHPDANIIFGAMVDERLEDQVWVTVVATGYDRRGAAGRRGGAAEQTGLRLREPEGEPRVTRAREPRLRDLRPPGRRPGRGTLAVDEYDIPEFLLPRA